MDIAELKSYSRPRRSPRQGELAVKKLPPFKRGQDIVIERVRYKITGRSRKNPITHWILTPLSDRDHNSRPQNPIEVSENTISETLAEQDADRASLKDLGPRATRGIGASVFRNGQRVI